MRIRIFSLFFLMACLGLPYLHGQGLGLRMADRYYEELAFQAAIPVYEDVLDGEENLQAAIRLADCYRLTGNSLGAERWYAVVTASGLGEPLHAFYYAQSLQRNGKDAEALPWFESYAKQVPDDIRGANGILACLAHDSIATHGMPARVITLGINSAAAEIGPAMLGNGLLFSSDREGPVALSRDHRWTGRDFLNLYWAPIQSGGGLGEPLPLAGVLNGPFHDGPVGLDSAQNRMLVTRNSYEQRAITRSPQPGEDGIVRLRLLQAERATGEDTWKWSDPVAFPYNQKGYSLGHPAWHPGGDWLIFAADLPGGEGGIDLWSSRLDANGNWSVPENLGPVINTPGDEVFPVWQPDGRLVFASDGHAGLGGLDQFVVMPASAEGAARTWDIPHNVGAPINSRADDFGLCFDAAYERGYFVSDRSGGQGGDDLYTVARQSNTLPVRVRDAVSKQWLPDVSLALLKDEKPVTKVSSDPEGRATMVYPSGGKHDLTASLDGFMPLRLGLPLPNPFRPAPAERILDLQPVTRIDLELSVVDRYGDKLLPDAQVFLDDLVSGERTLLDPDENGHFPAQLLPDRDYRLEASLDGYFPDTTTLTTEGLRGQHSLKERLGLVEQSDDVVIELRNIYYDLDRSYIRRDAAPDLDRLAALLLRYPDLTIELGSHTDSRGSKQYNEALSQRRAEAAVDYLVARGISAQRLSAQGYGESKPKNACVDGVKCNEAEYQANRRTEFRVLNAGQDIISVDRYDIPVNTGQAAALQAFLKAELDALGDVTLPKKRASGNPAGYHPANDLPAEEGAGVWFQRGRAFGVLLGEGTLAAADRFATYRSLAPLQVEASNGGRYAYVLGYFTERKRAEEVLRAARENGATNAKIVTYRNGLREP